MQKAYPFLNRFKVTSLYGYRSRFKTSQGYSSTEHKGMDLKGLDGNIDVVSCSDGTVVDVGSTSARGKYVLVYGNDEFSCLYQHLDKVFVIKGQNIACKNKIGVMGSTGNVSGAHLHLEVGKGTTLSEHSKYTINPADYLGMQNTSTLEDKIFNGNGYITGDSINVVSYNNSNQVVSSESSSSSSSSSSGYVDILLPSGEYYKVKENSAVESDWLYGRRYRVFVEIEGNKAFDVSNLRCTFEIIKTSYMEANQSILQIYNLSPEDENKLIKQGQRIIIEAGYVGSQYGKIFDGNVIQAIRSKENGTDYVLTLVSMDNDRYTSYGLINVALVAQQSAREAIDTLANKAKVTSEIGYVSQMDITYPRGKVMFGLSKDYLSQIASSQNSTYYSEDGKINIISIVEQPPERIKSYGPKNGLINVPTQTELGISCTVLLDPSLKINTFFHVDNEKITGYQYTPGQPVRALDGEGIYRVIRLTHKGDTRGNDWYSEIEAVGQAGILPSMIAGSAFYGW